MPTSFVKLEGNGIALIHTCETCGASAAFGFDFFLREAMTFNEQTEKWVFLDRKKLGRWYCAEHIPTAKPARAKDEPKAAGQMSLL